MPGPGVWQRKTAAAKLAAATVRDSSEGGRPPPRMAREREGLLPGNGTARSTRATHRARAPQRPGHGTARDHKRPGRGTRKAPRPVTLRWAVREYQCEDSYSVMIDAGIRPRSLTL